MTYDTWPATRPHPRSRRRRRGPTVVALCALALVGAVWQISQPLRTRLDLGGQTSMGVTVPQAADADAGPADPGGADAVPANTVPANTGPADAVPVDGQPDAPATGLDAELQRRFDAAQAAAAAEGVELSITSGWRSADEQQRIVDQMVEKYGSAEEAHKWVLPPERSAHVAGLAIDVGGTDGAYWLTEHGPEYGLCRTAANEVWHFEPLAAGATQCPEPTADASWGW